MHGDVATVGHLLAVRWDCMEEQDFYEMREAVQKLHASTGKKVIYVAIQDSNYREPSASVQKLVRKELMTLLGHCTRDYVVITAGGVMASLQKSVLKAVLAAARVAHVEGLEQVMVMSSLEEVFAMEAGNLPAPPATILAQLKAAKVLP